MKRKLTKAELEAEQHYAKMQARWDKMYGKLTIQTRRPAEMPVLSAPPGRETKRWPSKVTPGDVTARAVVQQYTGTAMLGVATLHKSNSIPIFSKQEAVEVATMRRN